MGRILETLKQADMNRGRPGEAPPAPRPFQPVIETLAEGPAAQETLEDAEEEVPFIEVGGPRSQLDASPSVLAASPVRAKKAEPAAAPSKVPAAPELAVLTASPRPGSPLVVFQPWPVIPPPLLPANKRFASELIAFHQPDHPVSRQYRGLLQALAKTLPGSGSQVLLFTAATSGTGATTSLLNLAIAAALEEKKQVAVVDANVQAPALARRLGLPAAPGLQEVLAGALSLQRALQETGQPNLLLLAAGERQPAAEGSLAGEAMRSLLRHLRARFEWILVDGPSWDGRPDLAALASCCDGIYLVVAQDKAQTPEIDQLLHMIPQQGGPLRGCILTQRP